MVFGEHKRLHGTPGFRVSLVNLSVSTAEDHTHHSDKAHTVSEEVVLFMRFQKRGLSLSRHLTC